MSDRKSKAHRRIVKHLHHWRRSGNLRLNRKELLRRCKSYAEYYVNNAGTKVTKIRKGEFR